MGNPNLVLLPAGQGDARIDRIERHAGIGHRVHLGAQGDHICGIDARIGILRCAAGTIDQRHRRRVEHAEFAFESGARRFFAGQFERQRMDCEVDACDVGSAHADLIAQAHAGINRRVNHQTAGKRLVGVAEQVVALTQTIHTLGNIHRGRKHVGKPALAFNRTLGAGESGLGHQRSGETILRGAAGVQAFGHAAKHFAQAGCLRCRKAKCPDGALFIETEQARTGRGCAKHARRGGDVPAGVIVRRQHGARDAAFDFNAGDKGIDQFSTGCTAQFGQRQHGRRDRPARMHQRIGMGVIKIEHVRADAIDQRGVENVGALAASEQRRLRGTGKGAQCPPRNLDRGMRTRTYRAAGPVDQRASGLVYDRRGQGIKAARDAVTREQPRRGNGVRDGVCVCHAHGQSLVAIQAV